MFFAISGTFLFIVQQRHPSSRTRRRAGLPSNRLRPKRTKLAPIRGTKLAPVRGTRAADFLRPSANKKRTKPPAGSRKGGALRRAHPADGGAETARLRTKRRTKNKKTYKLVLRGGRGAVMCAPGRRRGCHLTSRWPSNVATVLCNITSSIWLRHPATCAPGRRRGCHRTSRWPPPAPRAACPAVSPRTLGCRRRRRESARAGLCGGARTGGAESHAPTRARASRGPRASAPCNTGCVGSKRTVSL